MDTIDQKPKLMTDKEAEEYMASLTLTTPESLSISGSSNEDEDEFTITQNNRIIKAADELLLERMENMDGSLKMGEVIQAKDSAFKNNQLLKNKATENINININELKEKTPDELLAMLKELEN